MGCAASTNQHAAGSPEPKSPTTPAAKPLAAPAPAPAPPLPSASTQQPGPPPSGPPPVHSHVTDTPSPSKPAAPLPAPTTEEPLKQQNDDGLVVAVGSALSQVALSSAGRDLGLLIASAVVLARGAKLLRQDCAEFALLLEKVEDVMVEVSSRLSRSSEEEEVMGPVVEVLKKVNVTLQVLSPPREPGTMLIELRAAMGPGPEGALPALAKALVEAMPAGSNIEEPRLVQTGRVMVAVSESGGLAAVVKDSAALSRVTDLMEPDWSAGAEQQPPAPTSEEGDPDAPPAQPSLSRVPSARIASLLRPHSRRSSTAQLTASLRNRLSFSLSDTGGGASVDISANEVDELVHEQSRLVCEQVVQMRSMMEHSSMKASKFVSRYPIACNEARRQQVVKKLKLMDMPGLNKDQQRLLNTIYEEVDASLITLAVAGDDSVMVAHGFFDGEVTGMEPGLKLELTGPLMAPRKGHPCSMLVAHGGMEDGLKTGAVADLASPEVFSDAVLAAADPRLVEAQQFVAAPPEEAALRPEVQYLKTLSVLMDSLVAAGVTEYKGLPLIMEGAKVGGVCLYHKDKCEWGPEKEQKVRKCLGELGRSIVAERKQAVGA